MRHTAPPPPSLPAPFFSTRWAAFLALKKKDSDITHIVLEDDPQAEPAAAKAPALSGQAFEVLLGLLILVKEMIKVVMTNKGLKGKGSSFAANSRYRLCLGPPAGGPVTADGEERTTWERSIFDALDGGKANMSGGGTPAIVKAWHLLPKILTQAPMFADLTT